MPFRLRPPLGDRPGLRGRLAGAPRPVRPPPARAGARSCRRLRRHGVPGLTPARRQRQEPAGTAAGRCGELPRPRPAAGSGSDGPAPLARCRRSRGRGVTGSTAASSARASWRWGKASTPPTIWPALAEWVAPLGQRVWDHDLWTVPPPSQGYLTLAGAWLAERDGLPDDPDDGAWAVALVAAAMAAGRDRPEVLWDGAEGVELLAPVAARVGSGAHPRLPRPSVRWRPAAGGGRHHVPVHRRRPGHGRVADPVERGGIRQPPLRAGHRDQPPQPRHRVLPRARPPRGVRTGSPPAPHALARTGDPSRRRRSTPCSAPRAATASPRSCCRCWPGSSTPASRRAGPSPAGGGC